MRRLFPFIAVCFVGLSLQAFAENLYREGVIVPRTTDVYPSATSAAPRTQARQGERVKVYDQRGNRYLIQLWRNLDRIDGWVDVSAVGLGVVVKPADTVGRQRTYAAVAFDDKVQVFEKADPRSRILKAYRKGEAVEVLSQFGEWYRVRLAFADGSVGSGWVLKSDLKLGGGVSQPAPAQAAPPPKPERPAENISRQEEAPEPVQVGSLGGFRVYFGPLFDVRNYGARQFRIGAALDLQVSQNFAVGIPFTYAKGGGFSTIQAGADLLWRFLPFESWFLYQRTGILFERLAGGGKSFLAGTVDLGVGVDYRVWDRVSVYVEPLSVEVSPIKTKDVPWFVRAQLLAGLAARW